MISRRQTPALDIHQLQVTEWFSVANPLVAALQPSRALQPSGARAAESLVLT